jgi:hypothetical protein
VSSGPVYLIPTPKGRPGSLQEKPCRPVLCRIVYGTPLQPRKPFWTQVQIWWLSERGAVSGPGQPRPAQAAHRLAQTN